jgi:sulfonate transport system permease protein
MTSPDEASLAGPAPLTEPEAAANPAADGARPGRSGWRNGGALAVGAIVPLAVLAAWEGAAALGWLPGKLFPPPSAIAQTVFTLAARGELARHIAATFYRMGLGFAFGVLAGTVLGALTGYSSWARRLLDPTIQALRSIPSLAWVPLFILWLGIFETSKVTLIAVGVFFPVYLNLAEAIMGVDRKLVEVARTFRYSGPRLVRHVLLPATLPAYLVGIRTGLGMGWMFVVAAELMGASEGLGFLLVDGQQTSNAAIIISAIVLFAAVGKLTDGLLAYVGARFLRWQDAFKPTD